MKGSKWFAALVLAMVTATCLAAPRPYRNFKVTVYIPVRVVQRMASDPAWMRSSWRTISSALHVDRVFIESYRAGVSADMRRASARSCGSA